MANISQEELIAAMQSGGGASAGLIQVMQARLDSLVGRPSGLIETLPKPVQKRIKYLKVLQEEFDEREEEYEKELDELDKKYAAIYAPIFAKRAEIVKGDAEAPADTVLDSTEGADSGPAGIPEFWLGVLRANEITASQLTEKDEGILEYLVDISSEELTAEEECGFKLTFEFADNPYFENKILTKTYHMVDSDEPVLERAIGTKIDWKAGKNVTVKVLKKKPKQGRGGKSNARPITKTEAVDSFFSFFSPPKVPEEGDDDLDEEEIDQLQAALEEDYEIGETIRDQLIPNAVSWYTGEAEDEEEEEDEDDEEDGEEDDDEDDDDDNDDDEDDDEQEDRGTRAKGKQNVKLPTDAKEQPPECKQQ